MHKVKSCLPVLQVEVPFEFHRFIIGARGAGVRNLMETNDVNIKVPSSDQQSNWIVVTGSSTNVEAAREALLKRVEELNKVLVEMNM